MFLFLLLFHFGWIFIFASRYFFAHIISYFLGQRHNILVFSRSSGITKSLTQLETTIIFLDLLLTLEFIKFAFVNYNELPNRFYIFARFYWFSYCILLPSCARLQSLTQSFRVDRLYGLLHRLQSSPLVIRSQTFLLVVINHFICCCGQQRLTHWNPLLFSI